MTNMFWASLVAQLVKNLPAMQETWVQSLGWEDLLEKGKANPLQYSGLENSMDCIVHGVAKSCTRVSEFHFCFIDYAKGFDCMDHNKLWKILRDGNTRPPYMPAEKPLCRTRSNS